MKESMAKAQLSKDDPINIVGAGVFGLSTAIHLAERGYQKVTVFDKHDYAQSHYSYFKGADAASADINKIIRSAYGGVSIYQNLTLEAIEGWNEWNAELASGKVRPPGLRREDQVFINNGNLIMTDADQLPAFDQATVDSMETAGHIDTQLVTSNPRHCQIAKERGLGFAIDPFNRKAKGKPNVAVIDSTGGTAMADKACRFAWHKAQTLGVEFILGPEKGCLEKLCYSLEDSNEVVGVGMRDGRVHRAALTILACGGWTPTLLPQLDKICEATAGSVALLKIPQSSKLYKRFSPDNFPSWQYKMRDGAKGGLYGFAIDDEGWLKIGYRGTKYTNPVEQCDGKERSLPVTRWSDSKFYGKQLTAIPHQAHNVIQTFLSEHLPELAEEGIGISSTRICWYCDSYDNHLLIDRVPGTSGLIAATAGSGHAFKYLPVIGKYVVDLIEDEDLERECMQAWKWRQLQEGTQPQNVLMDGAQGSRALGNVQMIWDEEVNKGVSIAKARL